jgi:hypothetical protein
MLEAYLAGNLPLLKTYLAGGYLCPKLTTFEPKVATKNHPGAERSILRCGGSFSETLPRSKESICGQKRLSLKLWLILEP